MASKAYKPPVLNDESNYIDWKKEVEVWQELTDIKDEKKALAIFASLEGKAKKAALQMEIIELKCKDGVTSLTEKLDGIFLKDVKHAAYDAYEKFESFKRKPNMTIQDYRLEFEDLNYNLLKYDINLPDTVIACRYLISANLSDHHKELVRATIQDYTYEEMVNQVKKVLHDVSNHKESSIDTPVKIEKHDEEAFYGAADWKNNNRYRSNEPSYRTNEPSYRGSYQPQRGNFYQQRGANNLQTRGGYRGRFQNQGYQGQGYREQHREPLRCYTCGSTYHFAKACPEKRKMEDIKIQFYTEEVLHTLVGETIAMAILDSGCTKTVCGEKWLDLFIETLNEEDKQNIITERSETIFKFGDSVDVKAIKKVTIPAVISDNKVKITTEVVNKDIPLLFSKQAMKKANVIINFEEDKINIMGKDQEIEFSSTGHYCIPISKNIAKNVDQNIKEEVLLSVGDLSKTGDKKAVALKLHRQFGHPDAHKLKTLLASAKIDQETLKLVEDITNNCDICLRYKRNKPRPVVGFPMATRFNECVGMDLKQWSFHEKVWLIHIVDHLTRFSASSVIYSKKKEVIIEEIFKIWISIFGTPKKFLVDNGGEFANEDYRSMCENLNINLATTAAESPWSNGLVERHNGTLGNIVRKMMDDNTTKYSLETAVAWAIAAKNSLKNVHGFSPNQLVFGSNPNFPNIETNRPPALEGKTSSKIVADNINAMHSARQGLINSESCEKLRRAMKHNVRSSGDTKYLIGDKVYYRRRSDNCWKGPGTVIGQENQQVLVKHGSTYIRMHPCRIKIKERNTEEFEINENIEENKKEKQNENEINEIDDTDTDTITHNQREIPESNIENEENTVEDESDHDQNTITVNHQHENIQRRNGNDLPSLKDKVKYRIGDTWDTATIISRAGKATGKYSHWLNILKDDNMENMDWKSVDEWENVNDQPEEAMICMNISNRVEIAQAKQAELRNWTDNDVYEEVMFKDQYTISTRWVYSEKVIDGNRKIKARLVARGFEEIEQSDSDSPTCSKEALRITFMVIAANQWQCNSIDVKAAFLQGKSIERDIFLLPPKEFRKENIVWKLKKNIYGLHDASLAWYKRLKEDICRLGAKVSLYDGGLFYYHKNDILHGLMSVHVDDICWGGTQEFYKDIIVPLHKLVKIGTSDKGKFTYLGLQVNQSEEFITISQSEYCKSIEPMKLNKRSVDLSLTEEEIRQLRILIGQLNWLGTQSRPDIQFDCCDLMGKVKCATVKDSQRANKIAVRAKSENVEIKFQSPGEMKYAKLVAFHDASLANLKGGGSQGGHIIFISDPKGQHVSPISWQSRKIKRVVNSTLAAETLALVEAAGKACWIQSMLKELYRNEIEFPITCMTDSKTLSQAVKSTKQTLDKKLSIDIAMIKEMLSKNEIESVKWISKDFQIADCMTKHGANSNTLIQALSEGKISI